MKKLFFVTLLLCLSVNITIAQTNLDSLHVVWKDTTQTDSIRVKAFYKFIIYGSLYNQPDSAFLFAEQLYVFAKKKGLKKSMATARIVQGVSFDLRSDYVNALKYYAESLKIYQNIGDKEGVASSLVNMGTIFNYQSDYTNAINYYSQGLKIYEEIEDKKGIATSQLNIGLIYFSQGDNTKALNYFSKSLKIKEEIGDKKGLIKPLINLGIIYKNQGDYTKAMSYITQSLKLSEEIGSKNDIATSFANIGNIYYEQGDYIKALNYFSKSLKIAEEIGNKKGIAPTLNNIGLIYANQGDHQKAILIIQKALNVAQEIGAPVEIREASFSLFKSYKATKQYFKALEMYELYINSKESILSEESQRAVIQQEFKYNYEKQAAVDSIKAVETKKVVDAQITAQQAEIKVKKNQQYGLFGGLFLMVVFAGFMYNRFRITRNQKLIIQEKEKETHRQKEIIEEKHKEITDSINYAERIQRSFLATTEILDEHLKDYFVFFKPKDVVSGDFYWAGELNNGNFAFSCADSTGHGVPGAIMSILNISSLEKSIEEETEPHAILNETRRIIIERLKKDGSPSGGKDGMDCSVLVLNPEKTNLTFAAANNPILIVRNNELIEFKADKMPVGKHDKDMESFTLHTFVLQKEDVIYTLTDGYADQFGGSKGKKFMYKPLKNLLLSIQDKNMNEQKEILEQRFNDWKGDLEQVDDVCMIGVRI